MRVVAVMFGALGVGCDRAGPPPRDPEDPAEIADPEGGSPGIQIGQTGTPGCDPDASVPLDDPTVPADGVTYSAAAWADRIPEALDGTLIAAESEPLPLSVTLAPHGPLRWGDCEGAYLTEATVQFSAGDLLDEDLPGFLVADARDRMRWRGAVPLDAVRGTVPPPDLGWYQVLLLELVVTGSLDEDTGDGAVLWVAWTEEEIIYMHVADWSATAP